MTAHPSTSRSKKDTRPTSTIPNISPRKSSVICSIATRWWKRNVCGDIHGIKTQRLGADTFRVFTSSLAGGAVGDLIGFRSGTGDHIVRVTASSRMTLMDLTILNSANFAVAETLGGDLGPNHCTSITVKRGNRCQERVPILCFPPRRTGSTAAKRVMDRTSRIVPSNPCRTTGSPFMVIIRG